MANLTASINLAIVIVVIAVAVIAVMLFNKTRMDEPTKSMLSWIALLGVVVALFGLAVLGISLLL